jgi:RNA polymerase sigma-70 factor (ECF subfamily)
LKQGGLTAHGRSDLAENRTPDSKELTHVSQSFVPFCRGEARPADDSRIVERVLRGDTDAFNLLVRQWEKPIYNFIVRMIGDREEAMDLCQDAFMKAYRELATLKDRARFSAWLYRIAHNTCYSKLRRDQGKTFVELAPETRAAGSGIESRLAVEAALLQLPEDQREVVILKVYQSLKFEEIAAVQSAPVSTVKSRLYMGFEKLRLILG